MPRGSRKAVHGPRATVALALSVLALASFRASADELLEGFPTPDCAARIRSAGLTREDVRELAERGSGFWSYCTFATYEHGRDRDYELANAWLRRSAKLGFPHAQFELAMRLRKGEHMSPDPQAATRWLLEAADSGIAQYELAAAWALEAGEGTPSDPRTAFRLMRRAASGGLVIAQRELVRFYVHGIGTRPNITEAILWARKAAAQGDPKSLFGLGLAYRDGDGVTKNPILALALFRLAIARGETDPQATLALQRQEALRPDDRAAGADLAKLWRPGVDLVEQMELMLTSLRTGTPVSTMPGADTPAGRRLFSTGSGFFVNERGDIITNKHVVDGCTSVRAQVQSLEGTEIFTVEGRDITVSQTADLALFRTGRAPPSVATLAPRRTSDLGESIMVAGYPLRPVLNNGISVTPGVISGGSGPEGDENEFQISAPVQPGNSGGPVIDLSGQVVGVVVAKLNPEFAGTAVENVNYAITLASVRAFLRETHTPVPAASAVTELPMKEIARTADRYVVSLECWK
jgi:uncharacterized protein